MAIISADDFTFEPDASSTSPLWMQLRRHIARLIATGRLKPGDQLPKIRELAVALSINFNTVNKSYLSLASDGYVKSVRGKGVFVSDAVSMAADDEREEVLALLNECLQACKARGLSYDDTLNQMRLYVQRLKMAEARTRLVPGTNIIEFVAPEPAVVERLQEKGA